METMISAGKKMPRRRKIEIKKIERKSCRQVTFSRRKKSLFRTAAVLSVLCGADVAILVQSPTGNFFTFGNPSVDSVLHRFQTGERFLPLLENAVWTAEESRRQCAEAEMRLQSAEKRMKSEKICGAELMWWRELDGLEGMELEKLEELLQALERLRDNVIRRADDIVQKPLIIEPTIPAADAIEYYTSGGLERANGRFHEQSHQESNDLDGGMSSFIDQSLKMEVTASGCIDKDMNNPATYLMPYPIEDDLVFATVSDNSSYINTTPMDQYFGHDD